MTDDASTEAETPPQAELAENPAQDATASLPREPAAHPLAAADGHPAADKQESAQAPERGVPIVEAPAKLAATAPAEPWRRRALRALLYGSNVDRAAKARARVGLAILAFAAVYCVIAARLVMFASSPIAARRVTAPPATRSLRRVPDILDRNGEVLATDVRVPSLYGEPRRIIDVDEAVELLTADLPDLDADRTARAALLEARLRLAQARDHAEAAAGRSTGWACPASAS